MEKLNENTEMLVTSTKLSSWQAVLDFLASLHFKKERENHVHIYKNEKEWTVETNSSLSKPKHITLTTKSRGIGLFDLNW